MSTTLVPKSDALPAAGAGPWWCRVWRAPLWAHVAVLAAVLALLTRS